jgi:3-oxoacyl-[acyl-carrier protein] reductase
MFAGFRPPKRCLGKSMTSDNLGSSGRHRRVSGTQLSGKVCLIAGASGAIGSAVSKRFEEEGASLALTYLSEKPAISAPTHPSRAFCRMELSLDIRSQQQVEDAVKHVIDHYGTIHVLVNCTGVIGPIGATSTVPIDDWVQAVDINLLGSFRLTRAVLPTMLAQRSGKIIHFSGGGAAYARPFFTAYGASKAALVRFSESLADELNEHHIDVNAIAPGPVESRMWNQMRSSGDAGGENMLNEIRKMEETGGVPPECAADLAVFLASERSNGLSGRLISAVHDDWKSFDSRIPEIAASDAGTLRRAPFA